MATPTPQSQLPKAYDPQAVEQELYQWWESSGFFKPVISPEKQPFSIIMPPPNVTGELHLGHALTATVQDALTRYHRMLGDSTLWLPGADHAGIATQMVVERALTAEGISRHDIGRDEFVSRVWDWVHKYGGIIDNQHRRLGASCDWSRKTFTLDPGPSKAVRTTFANLYKKGLIYRGERIINWCPSCRTALSDLEVEHQDIEGALYHIKYLLEDGSGHVIVATTRPETLMGDTALAINPSDERYAFVRGKSVLLPILGRLIPVIEDEAVDIEFGTGALKITPGHDPNDFDTGQRHRLPVIGIMNLDGTLNHEAGPYEGYDRLEARKAIVEQLDRDGLLVGVEPYWHSVGHCQRSADIVEPIVSEQWFVNIGPIAKRAAKAVEDGRITVIPERFSKVYTNWMDNIRDWCISRQLWWGHRIPVWYCEACDHATVAAEDPDACEACGSVALEQDPDVLDTWFSSGLWPHSTLGWPEDTADLRYFYPTTVMETGYDILFFWVARMIMLGMENLGEVPFKTVYLHGLVRDEFGVKMSKTRGNVVDPLKTIDEYGTDALRFALATGTTPGNDIRISPPRLQAARNFANKLWNASRYVLGNLQEADGLSGWYDAPPRNHREDRWILGRLDQVATEVHRLWGEFQLGEAQRILHDFIWGEYCDWYIELAKIRLHNGEQEPLKVLAHVLERILRLLHPFMPFITETLWQRLGTTMPKEGCQPESIMLAPYPIASAHSVDESSLREVGLVTELIRSIRNARAEFQIEPQIRMNVKVDAGNLQRTLSEESEAIQQLARVGELEFITGRDAGLPPSETVTLVVGAVTVSLSMAGIVNIAAERKRLEAELTASQDQLDRLSGRLSNQEFLSKAPADVIDRERERLESLQARQARLQELIKELTR
jgi:valyl-tRNA synthetase